MMRSTDEHFVRNVTVTDMDFSDHFAVNFNTEIIQHRTGLMKIRYRKIRAIDALTFDKTFRFSPLMSLTR